MFIGGSRAWSIAYKDLIHDSEIIQNAILPGNFDVFIFINTHHFAFYNEIVCEFKNKMEQIYKELVKGFSDYIFTQGDLSTNGVDLFKKCKVKNIIDPKGYYQLLNVLPYTPISKIQRDGLNKKQITDYVSDFVVQKLRPYIYGFLIGLNKKIESHAKVIIVGGEVYHQYYPRIVPLSKEKCIEKSCYKRMFQIYNVFGRKKKRYLKTFISTIPY